MGLLTGIIKRLPGGNKLAGQWRQLQKNRRVAEAQRQGEQEIWALRQSRRDPTAGARVLVTGDLGYLGSRLCGFLQNDYDVVGFDSKAGNAETLDNYGLLAQRMDNCQFVVHTAGIPHPNQGPFEAYFEANVTGSLNVMRAAADCRVKRFIFFSSVGYYGCNIRGRLVPAYFPIDEAHPIASTQGRHEGMLDAYNQSKVLAEELLAYYGTNRAFEALSLRIAPANSKAEQYPEEDDSWRSDPRYRRGAFWTNCHPDSLVRAVRDALTAPGEFGFEAFNICDKYSPECVDIEAFLAEEYPDVPVRCNSADVLSLISPEKAEQRLGFRPCEDTR